MLGAMIRPRNPAIKIIQGESGSQSRADGHGALRNQTWTPRKQARQLVRRAVADLLSGVEFSSYFSCLDMIEALDGKVGEYLVIARKKGYTWYVGAITNWEERDLVLDLSVLPGFGAKSGKIFRDGVNANRVGKDYVAEQLQVMSKKVKVHLAKGGGAVMVF